MTNRIHITSSGPRTGTTLLTEVFKNCFNIDCSCDHEASIANSTSSFGNCNVVLTKHPSETRYLDKILSYSNNLFVVCVIRDPRDMIVSFHGLDSEKYFCGLNYWFEFLKDYKKLKNNPRFILLKYEDFTKAPDKTQEYLEQRLPFLERKNKFSEYHLHAKPDDYTLRALNSLRPIESKGLGNWKQHKPRIKQQISKHGNLTKSLIYFDYEKDESWLELLENVSIQNFVSYLPEQQKSNLSKKRFFLSVFNFTFEKLSLNPDYSYKLYKKIFKKIMV